ncbi:MAG TPA: DUF5916 domain-containing protein [Lysobacter sp.]
MLAAAPSLYAAPLSIPEVATDIVVDGVLDDAAWAQAATVDIAYETQPGDNLPASVRTTVRIAHTADALLIAFRAEDPDPSKIRAFLRDRDALYRDDFVGIMLDTFDDQRRAYEFFVNPLGVQADLIRDEATGNEDDAWDGLWTSAGRITADGYEAEMRIPFATLRFRDTDDVRRWSATFLRIRPREFRYQYFSDRIERGTRCMQCAFGKLEGFRGVRQGLNLEITPTLTVIAAESRDAAAQPWLRADTQVEPGLDVAWAPSPNLTLNATLNPDFSQVESDEAQLDLNTSFALFFPEKRPFFLEGADYFNTPLQVLYTRQIADPDAGVRVTGRSGRQAYGLIAARDATTQILVPGVLGSSFRTLEQDADALVGRYRFNLGERTTLGAIGTFRQGEDYRNGVAGFDARWRRGIHTLRAQWLHSDSRYPDALQLDEVAPRGDALFAHYSAGTRNAFANVQHRIVDPGFRADLGFISMVGYRQSLVGGGRHWFGRDGAKISKVTVEGDWDITHRADGRLMERELEGYVRLNAVRQTAANVGFVTRERFWNGRLFDETFYTGYVETTPLPGLKLASWQRVGDMLDLTASRMGRGMAWEPSVQLDIGRGIHLALQHSRQRLQRDGGTAFDARVLDARLSWQLDPRQRVRLSLQGSDVARDPARYRFAPDACPFTPTDPAAGCAIAVRTLARDVGAQLLYSYKLNPRTALYAGYSHGAFDTDREGDTLRDALVDSDRSVFFKLSYAWQPRG